MSISDSPASRRPFIRRFRLLKAYVVALHVLISYLGLAMAGWLRGPDWLERRRPELHRRNARRVVQIILELQGLFIKIGQLLSILTNFLELYSKVVYEQQ